MDSTTRPTWTILRAMSAARGERWSHYLPKAPGLRDSGLACLGAGEQASQVAVTRRRTLSSHALVVITEGSGFFRAAAVETPVVSPAWFWLFPGVWHEYGPGASGWTEHWILFEGIATRAYAAYGAWDQTRPLESGQLSPDELRACFSALRAATATPSRYGQLLAASVVHRLVGATVAARAPGTPRSAVQALVDGSAETLTVAERAAQLGISQRQLRTEVLAATGLTPHELVLRTRLARAQELLAESGLTVSEIAAQVGYDDPAFFSRLFVRRVGMSPTTFRRQQQRHQP
jgi:AraC-like DNA-binding protein